MSQHSLVRRAISLRTKIILASVACILVTAITATITRSSANSAGNSITLDPTVDPLQEGYSTEGGALYATGPRLRIDDAGPDRRLFYKSIAHLGSDPLSVDVNVRLEGTVVPDGEDTGVHFVLNSGEVIGTEIRVAAVLRGTERRLAMKDSGGLYTPGIPADWTTAITFHIERGAAGEGILTFNGQHEVVPAVGLAAATRSQPTFEFGTFSGPARVLATFGAITAQVSGITGTTRHVTTDPAVQRDPSISGDLVVFTDFRAGNEDVWYADLATGVETQVTFAATAQKLHDVSGNRIVYSESPGRVHVYTVSPPSDVAIGAPGDQNPRIDGDIVAFERGPVGNTDIIAIDLSDPLLTEIVIAATGDSEQSPSVSATHIAYERHTGGGDGDIVLYDLATNTETIIAGTAADERRPDIDGDVVVYDLIAPTLDTNVAIHDLSTGTTQVLVAPGNQSNAHISAGRLAYDDLTASNRDVMLRDIASGVTVEVTVNAATDFLNDIDGNRVVYTSNENGNFDIWLYEFTVAGADSTAPTITITTPPDGAAYTLNQTVNAGYACEDEAGGSGLASCVGTVADGTAIDTASVGAKSFTVDAADNAGNTNSAMNGYSVIYDFAGAGGFLAPVNNPPMVNSARAGSTIPVKFRLPDGQGGLMCDLSAVVSIQVQEVSCGAFTYSPTNPVEEVATAGSSGLHCDNGLYQYNWQTARTQKDKCYVFILTLNDGSVHYADFSLK